ncbi:unnamed protein product, partial [Ixodes hexagonus]
LYAVADRRHLLQFLNMAALTPVATRTSTNNASSATIDPEVYIADNSKQRQYNLKVLDLFQGSFLNGTNRSQQILDLGCGTGDFTREYLLPRCPNVEKMVAVDISNEMVEYAKEHFAHPRICYEVLDISGNGVTDFVKRYGLFDRVYSFFCLSWTKYQEKAFKNIAQLLKPDGGCLLVFGTSSIAARFRKKLATLDHWRKYREASFMLVNTIPPSVDLVDRDDLLSYILGLVKNASLVPTTCEVLQVTHTWSTVEEVCRPLMSLSCLSTLVTGEEKSLLLKDVAEHAAKLWAEKEAGGSPFSATVFLVRAHKPRP